MPTKWSATLIAFGTIATATLALDTTWTRFGEPVRAWIRMVDTEIGALKAFKDDYYITWGPEIEARRARDFCRANPERC